MSRAIRLTRLHAINWYGYHDSFDVSGNLVIAGIRGSGKTVLMDLIQAVLVVHEHKLRYNSSATGSRSDRDYKGYCLGDTKHTEKGVRKFMRNAVVTYIALECVWPEKHNPRVETWGLRIEFENASQSDPTIKPFLVPSSLERSFFLDADRVPLDLAAFRARTEQIRDAAGNPGRIFGSAEDYRREMSLPTHLNFDRSTIDYLLPAAMSFTSMDSFDAFCRRYILPAESVDIKSVKASYLVFRDLQTELAWLREQQEKLEQIQNLDQQCLDANRDAVVTRYLEAECRRDEASEQYDHVKAKVAELKRELSAETARLEYIEADLKAIRETIRRIEATFNETEDGKLYRRILQENEALEKRIECLKKRSESVEQVRALRKKNTASWLDQIVAPPFQLSEHALDPLRRALQALSDATLAELPACIQHLAICSETSLAAATEAVRPTTQENAVLEREIAGLNTTLRALRAGTLNENTVLLATLNRLLPRRTKAPAAQALWQLCEVTDESWRPAVEIAFTHKFAIVVDALDYEQAERIYYELKEDAPGESLVNPNQALALDCTPKPNSLALKLEVPSGHMVARALIHYFLGDIICVETVHGLHDHTRAITISGFMMQRPLVLRPRHYDNRPCIGQRGLERQQLYLQGEVESRRAAQKLLTPTLNAWRSVQQFFGDAGLGLDKVPPELAEAVRLPEEQATLDRNLNELKGIRTADLHQKKIELEAAQAQEKALTEEQRQLIGSKKWHDLVDAQKSFQELSTTLAAREDTFMKVRNAEDVSLFLSRLEELRTKVLSEFPGKDVAANKFNKLNREAEVNQIRFRGELVSARKLLRAHRDYGAKFNDYDPEAATNDQYAAQMNHIRGAQIPQYQEKAAREERNWHELFRDQVLEKLRERLLKLRELMTMLKVVLDKPIGNERYTIIATPNQKKEFIGYRQLLDLSALGYDGGLFATANTEVQETIKHIFQSLTAESPGKDADLFLDYRNYFEYDILVTNDRDPEGGHYSFNSEAGKASGGENQTPYFIAILASYLRAYRRHDGTRKQPALALVPIDEAFSKLSGQEIGDCINALKQLDLQGVFSMSQGNIPYAIDLCDQTIAVHKKQVTTGGKVSIRNIATCLTRAESLQRFSGGTR